MTGIRQVEDTTASPPARRIGRPSWLDLRVVLGVALLLASVLAGARVVSAADNTTQVWALTTDVAAGTTLTADDVRARKVRLFDDAGRYLAADTPPAGHTVSRDLGAGELLPRAALAVAVSGSTLVLPIDAQRVPDGLRRGDRVDVFASAGTANSAQSAAPTRRILQGVAVQDVRRPSTGIAGGGSTVGIGVRIPADAVTAVVQAARREQLDISIVAGPSSSPSPAPSTVR